MLSELIPPIPPTRAGAGQVQARQSTAHPASSCRAAGAETPTQRIAGFHRMLGKRKIQRRAHVPSTVEAQSFRLDLERNQQTTGKQAEWFRQSVGMPSARYLASGAGMGRDLRHLL